MNDISLNPTKSYLRTFAPLRFRCVPRAMPFPPAHRVPDLIVRDVLYLSLIISILLIAIIAFLLFPSEAHAEEITSSGIEVIFLIDDSKSVWDTTDPEDWRTAWFELAVDTLASGIYAGETRVSIITFGTTARRIKDFVPLHDSADAAMVKATYRRAHEPRGWSDLYGGLQEAYDTLIEGHRAEHKAAIVLITDGWLDTPTDEDAEDTLDYITKIEMMGEKFTALPYDIALYPIMVNHAAKLYPNSDLWRGLAQESGGSYYPALASAVDLSPILWDLWHGLTAQQPPATISLNTPATSGFVIPPHAHTAVFHLIKSDPQVTVQLLPPKEVSVYEPVFNSEYGEICLVERDGAPAWQGNWQIQVSGAGQAWLAVALLSDEHSLTINPASSAIHPACKPLDFTVNMHDATGIPVSLTEEINVAVESPEGVELDYSRKRKSVEVFTIVDTCAEGDYLIDASTTVSQTLFSTALTVPVALHPWLEVNQPNVTARYSRSEAVPLLATIMLGDKPNPATAQLARVIMQMNDISYTLQLSPTRGKAAFVGEIPAHSLTEGKHRLNFVLHSGLPRVPNDVTDIELFVDSAAVPVSAPTAQPTDLPSVIAETTGSKSGSVKRNRLAVYILIGLGALLIFSFIVYQFWGKSRSVLDGLCLEGGLGSRIVLRGEQVQTIEVSDAYGDAIARLKISPIRLGAERTAQFSVSMLDRAFRHIRVGPYTYMEGDTFIPRLGDEIEVGDHVFIMREA